MLLVVLSRIDVEACSPFLEGVPLEAVGDPDHPWWAGEERDIYLEAMAETIDLCQGIRGG